MSSSSIILWLPVENNRLSNLVGHNRKSRHYLLITQLFSGYYNENKIKNVMRFRKRNIIMIFPSPLLIYVMKKQWALFFSICTKFLLSPPYKTRIFLHQIVTNGRKICRLVPFSSVPFKLGKKEGFSNFPYKNFDLYEKLANFKKMLK